MHPKILFILGPTATGKTALADFLAQKFPAELISADSRQVYKGLDIVTGKDRTRSKIHGIDLIMPNESWSVSLFKDFAVKEISKIHSQKKLPIIVGGTGLYIKSIFTDLPPIPPSSELREVLEKLSLYELQEKLKEIDEKHFNQMNHSDQNNPRRLIRAIERATLPSGTLFLHPSPKMNSLFIGLTAPIEVLETRIKKRVLDRLLQDPRSELDYLKSFKLPWTTSSATSLGYQELDQYYQGNITQEELVTQWTTKERQYAKRQLTWFKKQDDIHWFDVTTPNYQDQVVDFVSAWYTNN